MSSLEKELAERDLGKGESNLIVRFVKHMLTHKKLPKWQDNASKPFVLPMYGFGPAFSKGINFIF